ncbi:MAG: hypothetical protein HOY79_49315, partial [Streptomyces sp.]|nr:hypothetical protein [Streptomyces sp.]
LVDQEPGTQALFSRAAEAAVTMADTELAEARTHAAEAEAERAEWETTAYRHANLWRNEQEASRRLLGQRQQMAEERFAWQERGDKAEARVAELEQQQAEQRAAVLREAADIAEEVALKRHQQHEIEREQGALDVMTELHRLADETATTPAEHTPQQPS